MFTFDSFIITQKTFYMTLGFIVLFLGTIINFACAGLFKKNSQKFSNMTLIATFATSSLCLIPFVFGFLSPYSTNSFYFFDKSVSFGGLEIFFCIIANLVVLVAFLISKKQLARLRFKQHYFNSLYLCSALAINFLIISKGFILFILSLEILELCTFFAFQSFRNRNVFFNAYKYITYSFAATALMVFAYALSNGFTIEQGVASVISKTLFIVALLAKGGLSTAFSDSSRYGGKNNNYVIFTYANLIIFYTYALALYKVIHELFEIGSVVQIFFVLLLPALSLIGAFKTSNSKNLKDFIYNLNSTNYCIILFLLFVQNTQVHTAAIIILLNTLIVNSALLSAGEILYSSKSESLKGICYTNPLCCNLLSIIIFIAVCAIPSGVFASRFFANIALAHTGLWSSIAGLIFALTYTILITAALNFISAFYQKPENINNFKNHILEKRMSTSCYILLISIFISFIMTLSCAKVSAIITGIL